ncbi:MAG: hypothetical protein R3236_10985, partial [Phycisphaeraceae bacterium]|nr:hypothetical protein [Phycisphaeraceae bacterium]
RRLTRLGHISFFGLAFINLAFVLTVDHIGLNTDTGIGRWASVLLVVGAATMPTVCYAAAWRQPLRHLFAVPVGCLVTAVVLMLMGGEM